MGDDGKRLTTLYARFDAITKELAGRDHSAARRGALDRVAANRLLAAPSRQDARLPSNGRHAVPHDDPRHARYIALWTSVMTSLRRVCPIMPENELEQLVTRVAIAEMKYEERAMASSVGHTPRGTERAGAFAEATVSIDRSGNGTR
jgi:hypothetical protein